MRRLMLLVVVLMGPLGACRSAPDDVPAIADEYLDRYFQMYPTRATMQGREDLDAKLEVLTDEQIRAWIRYQDEVDVALRTALSAPGTSADDRLDAEALLHQTARERHDYVVLRRQEYDPLFWTDIAAKATIFHVVREGRPLRERVADAVSRVEQLPALVDEATRRMTAVPDDRLSAELCRLAAGQAQAAAAFYRTGFVSFARDGGVDASQAATVAADALATLGNLLDTASLRATGTPRLGRHYTSSVQVGLGADFQPDDALAAAERDLVDMRQSAAAYGRSVWKEVMGSRQMPSGDSAVLRSLFERVSADHDENMTDYTARWHVTLDELQRFVRDHGVMPSPEPLALVILATPAYFVGQSVGGVFSPAASDPAAPSVLFLPGPRPDATPEQRAAFFRDFNRHFNRVIAPHQVLPGHVTQSRYAARHANRVRSVFPDPTYVEGWGTFCERLLLDLGWGGPLPRLAHLEKQLENVARTIVDIRVHTTTMTRDDVLRFARQEALLGDQFAGNLWVRSITTSPEMLTYHRGYREVRVIYDAERRRQGEAFKVGTFVTDMMSLGPVPLSHYRAALAR